MSWTEIKGVEHAGQCIQRWFGNIPFIDDYAQLATWLSNVELYEGDFANSLEALSKRLWLTYLERSIGSNRLTQAIQREGNTLGFKAFVANNLDHHTVYFNTIKAETFIHNLINKVLWKDSFAIHHGEFSHSYQWLAAGDYFGWGHKTSKLFSATGMIQSREPIPHMSAGGAVLNEKVYLWEWLVDSLNAKDKGKVAAAIGQGEPLSLNGHCFTDTFRHANNVHALLREHREDWFLGYYASRRDARLLDNTNRFEQRDFPAMNLSRTKFGGAAGMTKAAVTQTYQALEGQKHGRVDPEEGLYRGAVRVGANKPGPYRIFEFHGILGGAPDTFVPKFPKIEKAK